MRDLAVAEDTRDALIASGIPSTKLKIVVDRNMIRQECASLEDQSVWVLYDRHASAPVTCQNRVVQLPLPLESMIHELIEQGMIWANPQHIPIAVEKVISKKIE